MENDFPTISFASDLLQSLKAKPDFSNDTPSPNVITFLDRIESADPNSPDIQEDDTNANWGHQQFTASSLTCTTVLETWASVGTAAVALRLIASAIQTCKIARHICLKREIHADSYLSDAYLENMIERLWNLWKDAGAVCPFFFNSFHFVC